MVQQNNKHPVWTSQSVLIYGPHKSGSTLLQRMLDGHPLAWCYPSELKIKFLLKAPSGTRQEMTALNRRLCLLQDFKDEQWDGDLFERLLDQLDAGCVGLGDYIQGMAFISWQCTGQAPPQPGMWLAKEVGGRTNVVLSAWKQLFYDSRVIVNLRHPLHVVRSIVLFRMRTGNSMSLHRTFRALNDTLRVTWDCASHAGKPWVFPVLYERLTSADKEPLMRQLCSFLGLPFDSVLLSPTMLGEKAVVGTSSKQTTEVFEPEKDWKTGLGLVHILWMSLVYWVLNNYYSFKVGKWKMRDYTALSAELNRLAGEK
jgi:hypothetical protein